MHSPVSPYEPSLSTAPIEPRQPLTWPPIVERVAAALRDAGPVYLVGGVLRDALRRLPLHDLDLVTAGDGLRIARQLADAMHGDYYPIDRARRTGRALVNLEGEVFAIDVASFRGPDLLADLQGRDFTVNAIATPLTKPQAIIDPLDGQGDLLERRTLRQCSTDSIDSDPIRALRAVRMSLQFGLRMTPQTVAAARAAADRLGDGAGLFQPERTRDELIKTLSLTNAASALRLLDGLDLLPVVSPYSDLGPEQIGVVERLHQLVTIISPHRDDNVAANVVLGLAVMVLDRWRTQLQEHLTQTFAEGRTYRAIAYLAALSSDSTSGVGQAWADWLHLSKDEADAIQSIVASRSLIPTAPPVDARSIHRYYQATGEPGVTGVLLMLARHLAGKPVGAVDPAEWGNLLDEVAAPLLDAFFRSHQRIVAPPPLLTGYDLMQALDLPTSPLIGKLLQAITEAQAAGEVRTRDDALDLALRLLDDQ